MILHLHVATIVLAPAILLGCSKHHIATFVDPAPAHDVARAEIESCLSGLGMNDVSAVWPYSEYIEEFPEEVVAIWKTPPIKYASWLHQLLEIPAPKDYGTAWIRPHSQIYRVSFHKHDHSLPEKFSSCISQHGIRVQIEAGWDLFGGRMVTREDRDGRA